MPKKLLSEEQELELAERFSRGEGREALALAFGASIPTVARAIRKHGAQRGKPRKLAPEQEAEVVARYEAGEGQRELAEAFGLAQSNVSILLHRNSAEVRPKVGKGDRKADLAEVEAHLLANPFQTDMGVGEHFGVTQTAASAYRRELGIRASRGRYPHDEAFFDAYTRESCYWAGFIAADGSINDKNNVVALQLSSKDRERLEAFRRCADLEHPLKEHFRKKNGKTYAMTNIHVCNLLWVQALAQNFNVVPRKTYTLQPPPKALRESGMVWHFIRGFFDADGHAPIDGRAVQFTCASLPFLQWLRETLQSHHAIYKMANSDYTWGLYVCGRVGRAAAASMYRDSTPDTRLARKYARLERHLG